jgi:hypothetical protein
MGLISNLSGNNDLIFDAQSGENLNHGFMIAGSQKNIIGVHNN